MDMRYYEDFDNYNPLSYGAGGRLLAFLLPRRGLMARAADARRS
jgi:hypothetical protein